MKPICFIGARGGSKGIHKKNIRPLAGKPLIAHTIENSINSDIFSHVVVSTENDEIARISKKYGAEVPFMRPKKLATDSSSMNEVIIHGIKELFSLGFRFDIMVNRDCTVPFIHNSDVKGAIHLLRKTDCDLVCGVYRQHHNPYFNMMEFGPDGFLVFSKKVKKQIITRQKAPVVYQLNGLFAFYTSRILRYRKLYMPKTLPYEIPEETGLMIDNEYEFQIAEMIATGKIKI